MTAASKNNKVTVVVGASRGLGAELVKQLLNDRTQTVVAASRHPQSSTSSNLRTVSIDITDNESCERAAQEIGDCETLIITAGIGNNEKLLSTSVKDFQRYLDINVLGMHRVIMAMLPGLKARKTRKIIFFASFSGSFQGQMASMASDRWSVFGVRRQPLSIAD